MIYDQNNNSHHHHHILICRSTPAVVNRMRVEPKFSQPIRTNVKMKGESYPSDLKTGLTGGLPPSLSPAARPFRRGCRPMQGPAPISFWIWRAHRRVLIDVGGDLFTKSACCIVSPPSTSPRQRSKSKSHAHPARGSSLPSSIYRRWSGVERSFKSQNIGSTFSTFPLTGFSTRTGD
jgi:hypothetical protein